MMSNNDIKYAPVFYEGQHDDARTNLAIAQTAAREGATMSNYMEVRGFMKEGDRITGASVRDMLSGKKMEVKARSVLFCGGPFTDDLRQMEDGKEFTPAVDGAAGIHIVLPSYYAPSGIGLVDMSTSDGRFLFFLPWEGHVVVGTTDHREKASMRPVPDEAEIKWILNEAAKYLDPELCVRRQDVLSAWSGVRPLAMDPHADSSAGASRDHVISHNPKSGVVFVAGGKWTTYREMAEDAIDKLLAVNPSLKKASRFPCMTLSTSLVGKAGFTPNLSIRLIQEYGVSQAVANRLCRAYGGRAAEVLSLAELELGFNRRDMSTLKMLLPSFPIVEAEVVYAARHEWAMHVEDVIARRTRVAFLDKRAALKAIDRVTELMGDELGWGSIRREQEILRALDFMAHFGGPEKREDELQDISSRMATHADISAIFKEIDEDGDGSVSDVEIEAMVGRLGYSMSPTELSALMKSCDTDGDGLVSELEFVAWWESESSNPETQ